MARIEMSGTFSAVGSSTPFMIKHLDFIHVVLSGTFAATVKLQRSLDGGISWQDYLSESYTSAQDKDVLCETPNQGPAQFRLNCSSYTSGSVVYTIGEGVQLIKEFRDSNGEVVVAIKEDGLYVYDAQTRTLKFSLLRAGDGVITRKSVRRIWPAQGRAKAGASAGWGISPNLNTSFVSLSASTGPSTLVMAVPTKVGDVITAFNLLGQIESGGNAVTLDCELRKMTVAAADLVDASVASMTQLSVTADTALSSLNAGVANLAVTVGADETYYLLVTATTLGSTDIGISGFSLTTDEV